MSDAGNKISKDLIFTIFGVTGDLTERKLLPALYRLEEQNLLPNDFYLIGFARRDWSDDFFREHVCNAVRKSGLPECDEGILKRLVAKAHYVQGDFSNEQDYIRLGQYLSSLEDAKGGHIDKIFHIATAPSYYSKIFQELGNAGLVHCCGTERARLLIEKPFGHDVESALELNQVLLKHFQEDQIYRIDHYLGKDPVQNILTFRFANGIFENLWSAKHISNIQISASEKIGIENRGAYYEEAGALLDVVQNHLLQLLALICMDEPQSMSVEDVRGKKEQILRSVRLQTESGSVVKGQYIGYKNEKGVLQDSKTETFLAIKAEIDNSRWKGVPIFFRAGKALEAKKTQIDVEFKMPRMHFLGQTEHQLAANVLSFRIEPDERISLRLMVKKPGLKLQLEPVYMEFNYSKKYSSGLPDAYEKIIYEAIEGSQLLFVRSDSVIQQWKIVDELRKKMPEFILHEYQAGSQGPVEQDFLVSSENTEWWSKNPEA